MLNKRKDGYHNLETIFYPIHSLTDTLVVEPSTQDDIIFRQKGMTIDCVPENNLIVRCYRLMRSLYPAIGGVEVELTKTIPFGAGLGGGSSDAAHTAIALNELFHLDIDKAQLAAIVSQLGADCAFFIYNTPCYAEGIGEVLTPLSTSLKGTRIVMVKPEVAISTKEAYSGITTELPSGSLPRTLSEEALRSDSAFVNDFEPAVFAAHPLLADIKKRLQDLGAYYTAMSGSGSTIYGLFQDDAERRAAIDLALMDKEFASMVIFNDTLA
ncbi:MAG: 4-(cytidine 5'-diphospho)-2-C-methyl-D-erythritol kinase [Paludibacteraceae bacterium]|nr:4-(cytidine 5'-diphospho)-2-C-methyl-D-erythritol kinase [Paludibacteraceae bacterium]